MRVIFERVDECRYRIGVRRDGRRDIGADVPLRPAPGGGPVPHDLVHFVVEEQAGLRLGVFGQVAAGGDVGGFFRPTPQERRPARDSKRSRRVGAAGRADIAISERLAGLAARGHIADCVQDPALTPTLRVAINRRLAELLAGWHVLGAGDRLELVWPDDLATARGRSPRRRRPSRAGGSPRQRRFRAAGA